MPVCEPRVTGSIPSQDMPRLQATSPVQVCNTPDIDLEAVMLSEICQAGKDKYCMVSLILKSKKKKQMNKQNRIRVIKTETKGVLPEGRGWEDE